MVRLGAAAIRQFAQAASDTCAPKKHRIGILPAPSQGALILLVVSL